MTFDWTSTHVSGDDLEALIEAIDMDYIVHVRTNSAYDENLKYLGSVTISYDYTKGYIFLSSLIVNNKHQNIAYTIKITYTPGSESNGGELTEVY